MSYAHYPLAGLLFGRGSCVYTSAHDLLAGLAFKRRNCVYTNVWLHVTMLTGAHTCSSMFFLFLDDDVYLLLSCTLVPKAHDVYLLPSCTLVPKAHIRLRCIPCRPAHRSCLTVRWRKGPLGDKKTLQEATSAYERRHARIPADRPSWRRTAMKKMLQGC